MNDKFHKQLIGETSTEKLETRLNGNEEKDKRAAELVTANKKLAFQSEEKDKTAELVIANKELAFQSEEKDKRAAELVIANKELAFQSEEKDKRAAELVIANKELAFQSEEKDKRAAELIIADKELAFQNEEKDKRAAELIIADKERAFQSEEKGKRAAELIIADKELVFQSEEKADRAAELIIANKELVFQNEEKEKRAVELIIANKELAFQNEEKEKRAAELFIANKELAFQNEEKEKRAAELIIVNNELVLINDELESRIEERTLALKKVTERLAISEDRFRIAMEASHIGIYDADCINNVVMTNSIFLNLVNVPEYKQALAKESDWVQLNGQLEDYVYEQDLLSISQFNIDNLSMIEKDFYAEFRLKEDPNVWFSFIGQVIKEDESQKVTRFIGVLQNISEGKIIRVELKAAKDEAEEASQTKSQFLANMSHEIRTPMNAISGFTYLIGQTDLNDSQKNYVLKIEVASITLLRIINDILDFSKIEAGKLEIENIKFNINMVLENVSNLYTNSATKKGIDINFDTLEAVPDMLIGDPLRLEQIISNLLTNAIKFTNQGEVNFSIRVLDETENKVKLHFSVTDTGIGLTKEQIEKLFTAFTQADGSMTRKYGGTGLGLTISKQLVELMNGEIWVESVYGEGASFQFNIPFDKAIDLVKPSYAEHPELQGKNVLVVDHNKTSLIMLVRMLRSFSFKVTTLRNPFEAIDLLQKEDFDLLVIDFNLPELSGIELYKRLAANTEITVPKTIFISATGRESYYTQAKQLGVNYFLVKPINQSLMFDAVMHSLKGTSWNHTNTIQNKESKKKYQRALANKRVLLVEDNEINQLVAKDILEQVGILVSIAGNGEEAIAFVSANKLDAVLMDVQMPVMDGYKATKILRKTYSSSELPIIAMTANALKGDRERSIESGMNDYVSKPITPEILFETLVKWLSGEKPIKATSNEKIEILDLDKTLKASEEKLLDSDYDIYEALSNLLDALEKAHSKEIKYIMGDLIANVQDMRFSTQIKETKQLIEHYRYKDAKAMIEGIMDIVKGAVK